MCVPEGEIFADQFAFFVTGKTSVRSGYNVPPFASRAAFGVLLKRSSTRTCEVIDS